MRDGDAREGSGQLRGDVAGDVAPGDAALPRVDQSHRGIEVRAGHRSEGEDQRDQRGAGCGGVGKQRDGDVARRQTLPHDSGADDRGQEQRRADRFGREPTPEADAIRHSIGSAAGFRLWFHGADEGAHEFSIDLRGDRVHVDALAGEKFARVFDAIDARGLDVDGLEASRCELRAVIVFFERAGDAADP